MHIVWTIIIGLVIGLVARAVKPGDDRMGFIMTGLLGIAGAMLAKFVGQSVGWYRPNEAAGFIASVAGAILLLVIFGLARRRA
jgi:uncharacterized membrane protein YeaQ/YmgE (transglycosylase-associated protein family)